MLKDVDFRKRMSELKETAKILDEIGLLYVKAATHAKAAEQDGIVFRIGVHTGKLEILKNKVNNERQRVRDRFLKQGGVFTDAD